MKRRGFIWMCVYSFFSLEFTRLEVVLLGNQLSSILSTPVPLPEGETYMAPI